MQAEIPHDHVLRVNGLQCLETRQFTEEECTTIKARVRARLFRIILWVLLPPVAFVAVGLSGIVDLIEHGGAGAIVAGAALFAAGLAAPAISLMKIRDAVAFWRWLGDVSAGETLLVFGPGDYSMEQAQWEGYEAEHAGASQLEVRASDGTIVFCDGNLCPRRREAELRPLAIPPANPVFFALPEEWRREVEHLFGSSSHSRVSASAVRRRPSSAEAVELQRLVEREKKVPWKRFIGISLFVGYFTVKLLTLAVDLSPILAWVLVAIVTGVVFLVLDYLRGRTASMHEADEKLEWIIRLEVDTGFTERFGLPESTEQVELLVPSLTFWTIGGVPTPWREAA